MRRRMRRSSSPFISVSERPSNSTSPAVGSYSCKMARPVVDLPQPLSPTRPSVSPLKTVERDAVYSLDITHMPLKDDPLGDGEIHLEILDTDEHLFCGHLYRLPLMNIHPAGDLVVSLADVAERRIGIEALWLVVSAARVKTGIRAARRAGRAASPRWASAFRGSLRPDAAASPTSPNE